MCGKWRAVPKGYDVGGLLRRSVRRKWGSTAYPALSGVDASAGGDTATWPSINTHNNANTVGWFCWMNTWDESTSSCTAPQEDLYACKWNLGSKRPVGV